MLEQPENPVIPQCENAQVRSISREVDLAWVAGIVDGEGYLDFNLTSKQSGRFNRRNYFAPKVRITNTDMRMIRKISQVYVESDITFFYALNSVQRYKNRKTTWRNQMEIGVCGLAPTSKLLSLIEPYLVNKQPLARLMLKTIAWVQQQPHRGRMSKAGVNYCERPEFLDFQSAMKAEKQFHIDPSTIARPARQVLSW